MNPKAALNGYDSSQLTQTGIQSLENLQVNTSKALAKLEADRLAGKTAIQDVELTDEQVSDLLEFLNALTDPCVKERSCLAKWIVDPVNDVDPNGDQLDAVDGNGNLL